MITAPRFFRANGTLSVVFVRLEQGVIVDVSNPVRLQGGENPQELIATIDQVLGRAMHEAPVLDLADLSPELQARFPAPAVET
jgi:hypothetical protein